MYFVLENFNIFNSTIFENSFFAIYPSSSRFFSVLILVVEVVQKLYYCGLISSSETLSNFPKAFFQFQIYSAMSRPQTERFDRFTLAWFVSLFPTFQFWNMNASSLRTRPKSQQIKTTTDVSLFTFSTYLLFFDFWSVFILVVVLNQIQASNSSQFEKNLKQIRL